MGNINLPAPAALIAGITFADNNHLKQALSILIEKYGPLEVVSPRFDFTATDYYADEMGKRLQKQFYCFQRPILIKTLPSIKVFTNKIERKCARKNNKIYSRTVNIDPGYVTLSKLVLASTKDYSHRIFIGSGIYAEVTLTFSKGCFSPLITTYPDYKTPLALDYFNDVREFVKGNRYQWTQRSV